MGTWSHLPFGNDTACDWAYDLEQHSDYSLVARAFQNVLDNGAEYLDADVAVEAVAAAEVLAKALGRGTQSDAYTETVEGWLKSVDAEPSADLLSTARLALNRILEPDSELVELWEDSDDFQTWNTSIRALQTALAI